MRIFVWSLLAFATLPVYAGNYSSRTSFTMIANCMDENGGQTQENLFMCSCRADLIQAGMSAEEYEEAITVERYRELPADKGAVFRDSELGQKLFAALKKIRKEAAETCPVIQAVKQTPATNIEH